jgi:hypothetical protein
LKSSQWPRSTQIKLPPGNPARFIPLATPALMPES